MPRGFTAGEETVVGVVTARKKKLRWPDVRARAVSEGEGRKEGTDSVNLNGPRTGFCSGPKGLPRPLFIFFVLQFLLFYFLFFLFLP
jgi:hypothetical protein